jgi:hypothetical protein
MFSNKIGVFIDNNHIDLRNPYKIYTSLAELNEEWEDAPEEPKEYWFIDSLGEIQHYTRDESMSSAECGFIEDSHLLIGNVFATKEEAEKAVEKLKAWQRLKEQGFRFKTYQRSPQGTYDIYANWDGYMPPLSWMIDKDLDLLFGGEE